MKVALVGAGSRGDIQPLMALGQRLLGDGHQALLCASPDFAADARRHGLEFRGVGRTVEEIMAENAADLVGGARRSHRALDRVLDRAMALQFEALPQVVAGADAVVGAGVMLGGRSAAECYGIPYHYLVYCPAVLRSPRHTPALFPARQLPRWLNGMAWRIVERGYDRMLRATLNRHRRRAGLPAVESVYRHVLTDRPLLACDEPLAPAPADAAPRPLQVGYLFPEGGDPLPPELETFLAAGPPPIYFGFGSMSDPDPVATTRLFVETARRLGRRALISEGLSGLGGVDPPPEARVVGSLDHARLFSRVAAVVHHGGAGTTAIAARAGVPQVVVPHLNEQHYWGLATLRAGIGVAPIPRERLTVGRLVAGLEKLLLRPGPTTRARCLAAELAATHPAQRAAAEIIGPRARTTPTSSFGATSWPRAELEAGDCPSSRSRRPPAGGRPAAHSCGHSDHAPVPRVRR